MGDTMMKRNTVDKSIKISHKSSIAFEGRYALMPICMWQLSIELP